MKINILKAIALILTIFISLEISTSCINNHIIDVEARQKTLADALIKKQAEEMMKEAEKKIEQTANEQKIEIKTEKVEIKPPVVEPKKEDPKVADNKDSSTNTDGSENNGDTSQNGNNTGSDNSQNGTQNTDNTGETEQGKGEQGSNNETPKIVIEGIGEFETLDDDAIKIIEEYLIQNYFLNGYEYVAAETDEALKAEKLTACEIEDYVVRSLSEMYGLVNIVTSLDFSGFEQIKQNVTNIKTEFQSKYIKENYSTELGQAIDKTNEYFDLADVTLDKFSVMIDNINNSSNALLALTSAMSAIQNDIRPAVNDVINSGIDLKEVTNPIYLKGTEGKTLLTRDEVLKIISIVEENMF